MEYLSALQLSLNSALPYYLNLERAGVHESWRPQEQSGDEGHEWSVHSYSGAGEGYAAHFEHVEQRSSLMLQWECQQKLQSVGRWVLAS